MGIFRNTSIPLKLYEITLFPTGSSAYYSVYENAESLLCWWSMNFKCRPWALFSPYRPEIFRHCSQHYNDCELKIKTKQRNAKIDLSTWILCPRNRISFNILFLEAVGHPMVNLGHGDWETFVQCEHLQQGNEK